MISLKSNTNFFGMNEQDDHIGVYCLGVKKRKFVIVVIAFVGKNQFTIQTKKLDFNRIPVNISIDFLFYNDQC